MIMMPQTAAEIRQRGVLSFRGSKPYIDEPGEARTSYRHHFRRSWRSSWPTRLLQSQRPRDYVLVHSESPASYHSRLYTVKEHDALDSCLHLHRMSHVELWHSPQTASRLSWYMSVSGVDEDEDHWEWVIRLQSDEAEARLCHRVLSVSAMANTERCAPAFSAG